MIAAPPLSASYAWLVQLSTSDFGLSEKGKGYRDKPDHSTNSAIGRVVPITLPLFKR